MGFTLRYAPAVIHLRELLQTGAIGEIRHVQAFQQNGQFLDPAKPFHWKMDPARTGGGAIVEYGVHTLDLLRWLIGEVDRVSATSRTYVPARPATDGGMREVRVDDSTAVLLEFVGGATGMCHASWATAGRAPGLEVRVYGSRGALKCALSDDLPGSEGLWIADAAEQRFEPVEIPVRLSDGLPLDLPWWQRFSRGLIEDFVAEIEGRTPASATFADGLAAQRLVEAVVIAAEERRWVDATC
jgi:predicted dehydrogenase